MSAIAFLQQLLDAGLPLEAAITAARIHEETMASAFPAAPSKAAERTRRWRERKASQNVTDRHEPSHGDASDALPLPLPSSPQTPQQPTPTPERYSPRVEAPRKPMWREGSWRSGRPTPESGQGRRSQGVREGHGPDNRGRPAGRDPRRDRARPARLDRPRFHPAPLDLAECRSLGRRTSSDP